MRLRVTETNEADLAIISGEEAMAERNGELKLLGPVSHADMPELMKRVDVLIDLRRGRYWRQQKTTEAREHCRQGPRLSLWPNLQTRHVLHRIAILGLSVDQEYLVELKKSSTTNLRKAMKKSILDYFRAGSLDHKKCPADIAKELSHFLKNTGVLAFTPPDDITYAVRDKYGDLWLRASSSQVEQNLNRAVASLTQYNQGKRDQLTTRMREELAPTPPDVSRKKEIGLDLKMITMHTRTSTSETLASTIAGIKAKPTWLECSIQFSSRTPKHFHFSGVARFFADSLSNLPRVTRIPYLDGSLLACFSSHSSLAYALPDGVWPTDGAIQTATGGNSISGICYIFIKTEKHIPPDELEYILGSFLITRRD